MSGHDDHERGCHHGHEHPEHPHHEDEGGPEGTDFLDLELSQMLAGMARGLAKEAAVEVLRELIHAEIKQRLGDRLAALAKLTAADLVEDFEANLEIEAAIEERQLAKALLDEQARAALRAPAKKSKK